jgi:hypothetical protein
VDEAPRESRLRVSALRERAYVNAAYAEAVEHPSDITSNPLLYADWTTTQSIGLWLMPTAMIRLDQARYLACMRSALRSMGSPYRTARDAFVAVAARNTVTAVGA